MYHQLKEGSGNIPAFKIAGGLTRKQKEQICKVLEKQIGKTGKTRLLLVVEPYKKMDAESLLFELNFTLSYADKIRRMALVGNRVWENTWIALNGILSGVSPGEKGFV